MKRLVKLEIFFGLFAIALIYVIIAGNASITGFITSPSFQVSLVYPPEDYQTTHTSMEFMFKYPYDLDVSECSLLLNGRTAKTATGLLSPVDTRIRVDLVEGTYIWSVECFDESTKTKLVSVPRKLLIGKEEVPELKITKFANREGYIYEFELKEGLELKLDELIANDVIKVNKGINSYEMHLIRVIQDYLQGLEMVEFMIIPGNRRVKFSEGESSGIDFNNDGENEMYILLEKLAYRKAYFVVSTEEVVDAGSGINPPKITINPKPEEEENEIKEQVPASVNLNEGIGKTAIGILELFLIGLIVVLIIALAAVISIKRKHRESEYISSLKQKLNIIKEKGKARKKAAKNKGKTVKKKK